MSYRFILLIVQCLVLNIACDAIETNPVHKDYDEAKAPYKFYAPDSVFELHWDLEEISGLTYYKQNLLLAVQDERGIVYVLDARSGDIIDEIKFGKNGDYEGVEVKGDSVFIIESDGDIFTFKFQDQDNIDAEMIATEMKRENDVEGIGFYKEEFILALKADGDVKDMKGDGKGIYTWADNTLKPLLYIDKKSLEKHIGERKYFNEIRDFDPSAIAVHPINGDFYILSADKVLVVYDSKLKLKEVVKLSASMYPQPEGICFAPDGTLFISSEGDDFRGKLFVLKQLQ